MKCSNCENKKELKTVRISYKYKDCGLENVTLIGVTTMKCNKCGEEYFNFGDIENLHRKIAEILLQKADLLTGREIKFLRKHLGYSGAMFAHLTGYAHETISRIENDKQEVAEAFDRLVRFAVANKMPDRDYDLHDLILKNKGRHFLRIELSQSKNGSWLEKGAA